MKQVVVDVVLAEDTPSDAELSIRALKKTQMAKNIIHVEDGLQAINFLFSEGKYADRDVRNGPRVIILDLKMPFPASKF